ncbi:three-helix bundle dimerization domain-containing protein [Microlunatus sp. Y2014]|uniref:arsenate reductase/protein-tyrosine-phosphatase family protein n=1 Tax=Microlunatus sp. Y2014 TaxID=3418488 RepID=UPI003DA795FA
MTAPPGEGPRWFATPLDQAAAASRARQVKALTEPDRLRVLSGITARADGTADVDTLVAELEIPAAEVHHHVTALAAVGLLSEVADRAGWYVPTADTWVRFARLVAGSAPAAASPRRQPSSGEPLPPVLQRVVNRLVYRFHSTFSRETVERYVTDSYHLLSHRAKVPQHLVSLTTRFAEDRLGALATAGGRRLRGTPEILFVCVQNAGRSQMAAALLRHMAGDQVHIRTAGSRPARQIDPTVMAVLDELGVPVVAEFPKPLTDEVVRAADYVITMGCGDACPVYPGRRYMDWPIPDPVGRPLADVRAIRDEMAERIRALCTELELDVGPL